MFPKNIFVKTLLVLCCLGALSGSGEGTFCSLDAMKELAMEACDHLFGTYDVREKRSIEHGYSTNNINTDFRDYHHVRRSFYPKGGYLKVTYRHCHKLTRLPLSPPYKVKKAYKHEEKMRIKRNDDSYSSSISYCCYNRCDEDFFC